MKILKIWTCILFSEICRQPMHFVSRMCSYVEIAYISWIYSSIFIIYKLKASYHGVSSQLQVERPSDTDNANNICYMCRQYYQKPI